MGKKALRGGPGKGGPDERKIKEGKRKESLRVRGVL